MDRPLSEYEKHINAASLQLCQENASLLGNRKKLFDLAKQKIDADGYTYKKKTSRSKVFGNSVQKSAASGFQQANITQEMRQKKINELQEDIQACKESISLLEKQRSKFATAEKFIQAAGVVEQIKTHRKKMRELELELAKHENPESRSKKYHKEKQKKLASGKSQPQKQQQQLKFVLPNAAPTCTAPANTMRPTGMMEDSSTRTSNYSCTESSESHTGVTKQPLTPANTESSTGMMETLPQALQIAILHKTLRAIMESPHNPLTLPQIAMLPNQLNRYQARIFI